jgi:hypothetical protein
MVKMLFDFVIIRTLVIAIGFAYRWLEQNVISYILNFVRGFEHVLLLVSVIAFLLIIIYVMIKQVKRLPKSYVIEIEDVFGEKTNIDGLRLSFRTYSAAKSYSEFYSKVYKKQYNFRVVGDNENALSQCSLHQ